MTSPQSSRPTALQSFQTVQNCSGNRKQLDGHCSSELILNPRGKKDATVVHQQLSAKSDRGQSALRPRTKIDPSPFAAADQREG